MKYYFSWFFKLDDFCIFQLKTQLQDMKVTEKRRSKKNKKINKTKSKRIETNGVVYI